MMGKKLEKNKKNRCYFFEEVFGGGVVSQRNPKHINNIDLFYYLAESRNLDNGANLRDHRACCCQDSFKEVS